MSEGTQETSVGSAGDAIPAPFPHEHAVEAFGVRVAVGASDPQLLERVSAILPPGALPCEPSEVGARFGLVQDDATYRVVGNGIGDLRSLDPEIATGLLDAIVRGHVARQAPDRVFLHAGVVAYQGRAIVLPGHSMSGKTTLVGALVRAGAVYYSEEYAVLDRRGFVHPYPKPLSIRGDSLAGVDTPVESLGGFAGTEAVPAGVVAVTSYSPGAEWRPSRLSPARGVLELMPHALPVLERPEQALAAVAGLVAGAVVLASDRGEATALAPRLLAELDAAAGSAG